MLVDIFLVPDCNQDSSKKRETHSSSHVIEHMARFFYWQAFLEDVYGSMWSEVPIRQMLFK